MPVTFAVDEWRRLVQATFTGAVTHEEFRDYFAAVEAAGLHVGHDALLDLRRVDRLPDMPAARAVALGVARRWRGCPSRRAAVAPPGAVYRTLRMFALTVEAAVPAGGGPRYAVFRSADEARAWLDEGRVPAAVHAAASARVREARRRLELLADAVEGLEDPDARQLLQGDLAAARAALDALERRL